MAQRKAILQHCELCQNREATLYRKNGEETIHVCTKCNLRYNLQIITRGEIS
jgi:acetyl-CoA carboxylase beta subunit